MNQEFKSLIKGLNIRHPVSEIAALTGFSKSVVSEVYNDKKEATANFIRILKSKISQQKEEKEIIKDIEPEYIVAKKESKPEISDTTNALTSLAESVRIVVQTNAELVTLLKHKEVSPVRDLLGTDEGTCEAIVKVLKLVAKAGSTGWSSEKDALDEIHTFFYVGKPLKQEADILSDVGKQSI